jgi:DNA-binding NarL/FixJ family response regulator
MASKSQPQSKIRMIIADDHPLVRDGLRKLIETQPDFEVIAEASDGVEAIDRVQKLKPDILLLDFVMPRMGGLEVLAELARSGVTVRTILLSGAIEKPQIIEAIVLGAYGLILKQSGSQLLFKAIRAVAAGQLWIDRESITEAVTLTRKLAAQGARGVPQSLGLTPRERQVVEAVAAGQTNKEIAKEFGISEHTVKHHLTNIFDKVGVSTRLELGLFAISQHLTKDDEKK